MKKFIFALILGTLSIMTYGQEYFNKDYNKNFSMQVGISRVGNYNHNLARSAENLFGLNKTEEFGENNLDESAGVLSLDLSVYGFYFSFDCASSVNTANTTANEGMCNMFYFGYKVPVAKWLSIYPLVGHVKATTGYTENVNHSYESTRTARPTYTNTTTNILINAVDYGGGIDIKLGNWFIISGKYTKYSYGLSAGVVIDLNNFAKAN